MKKQSLNLPNFAVLFASLALAFIVTGCGVTEETVGTKNTSTVPTTTETTDSTSNVSYTDGTYTAVGNYQSPGGAEEIGVTVTLKDNVITDVSVEPKATRGISVNMQKMFADNYKPMVVGKNINEVHLGKVSGSSLTPKGFNDALVKIEAQAS